MKDKIVVFDSGLGGLNIYKTLTNKHPNENYIYFADELYLPYGTKSVEFLKQRIRSIIEYFKDAKAIVIACNTASSIYRLLDLNYPNVYEIIDVTSQYAYNTSKNKRIGVIATDLTIELGMYQDALNKLNAKVFPLKYSELVDFIEGKDQYSEEEYLRIVNESLKDKFSFFKDSDIDSLICGCTHFGFLIDEYKKHLTVSNYVISDDAVCEFLENKIKFTNNLNPSREIYTSGDALEFSSKIKKIGFSETVSSLEV